MEPMVPRPNEPKQQVTECFLCHEESPIDEMVYDCGEVTGYDRGYAHEQCLIDEYADRMDYEYDRLRDSHLLGDE